MKKAMLALCLCLALLLCAACATPDAMIPVPEAQSSQNTQSIPQPAPEGTIPPYTCSVTLETIDEEIKADDGTLVLHVSGSLPHVEISNNENAAAAIYNEIKDDIDDFNEDIAETTTFAKEDYAERGSGFMPYELGLNYTTRRADRYCISFSVDEYSFTGGAHPNSKREGSTFDTATGRELDFEDIVTDEKEARAFVGECIKAYLDANKDVLQPFDDYADHIDEILEEDDWYFTATDFVMVCNEYIVGPHAMGIVEVPIAYSDFLQLKSEYTVAK